jgi:hypothetical protein
LGYGQKKVANQHRAASTAYPCYLPVLGDLAGAGRADLPLQKYVISYTMQILEVENVVYFV